MSKFNMRVTVTRNDRSQFCRPIDSADDGLVKGTACTAWRIFPFIRYPTISSSEASATDCLSSDKNHNMNLVGYFSGTAVTARPIWKKFALSKLCFVMPMDRD